MVNSIVSAASVAPVKVKTSSFNMIFDGQKLALPEGQYVFAVNGTSYMPLRFVSYALQKSVNWDSKALKVTVSDPTKQEAVILKDYLTNVISHNDQVSAQGGVTVQLTPKSVKFAVNGQAKLLPSGQNGYIVNGALYVPVRFLSEAVGSAIQWDAVKKQVTAESETYRAEHGKDETGTGTGNTSGTGSTGGNGNGTSDSGAGGDSTGGATGGGAGGVIEKPTYESIKANAEQRLTTLKNNCQSALMKIAIKYSNTDDPNVKETLKNQGYAQLDSCTAKFNTIISDTEKQLKANGYGTDVLQSYRDEFNSQVEAGRVIMQGMA
ncbi:copper amine oxidase N-terminal domain-containing protein [Paenibacillus sp. OV219]|uniref:copper amine oxidase N-terminal domain-containing protein n=1 Tax=Paenibacillus sp. OV219 TaxID=1884377 RepID=UPI0008B4CA04|nr:copper amine oxidase N-terminal domain-containing protein [Paenibacillus sp. OV219]SEN61915.1 Copper amine oxidase N-terminal domain-containing protein [Paenibacillus sp. OV219]